MTLLTTYGYWLLFGWSFIEGEIGLILSGILVKEGVFDLQTVLMIAISGAFLGDLTAYVIGRWVSDRAKLWLDRYPKTEVLTEWIKEKGIWIIFIERYLYGTHVPILLILGVRKFSFKVFLILDLIAVSIWASIYVGIGYFFGKTAQMIIERYQHDYLAVSLLIFMVIAIWVIWHKRKNKTSNSK
jgi:membrane protein DedA with SNARE-associated domain